MKRSILWCIFHHPLKIIIRTVILWFVLMIVWYMFSDDGNALMDTDIYYAGTLIVAFLVALRLVQLSSNKELNRQASQYNAFQAQSQPFVAQPKKKKKKSLLFGAMKSMNNSMNRELEGFANGLGQAMMGSGKADNTSWRERQAEADQEARRRANALDMQKKAEWDAMDAAKKGKDKAAWQRKNDADYWRNQARR